jgi:peroxiredoxin
MSNAFGSKSLAIETDEESWWNRPKTVVPSVEFHTREPDPDADETNSNPYKWVVKNSFDYFAGKRVVLFSLPGAFTPTCSTMQLPGFEEKYDEFKALGIDDIYCISVNDSFVMNAWAKSQNIKNIKVIPDGSSDFTSRMNMAVDKENLGFGVRSWRYAMVVNNGKIEQMFVEPGKRDNAKDDPYGETSPDNILAWLKQNNK